MVILPPSKHDKTIYKIFARCLVQQVIYRCFKGFKKMYFQFCTDSTPYYIKELSVLRFWYLWEFLEPIPCIYWRAVEGSHVQIPWWDLKGWGSPASLQYWKWADGSSSQNITLHRGHTYCWEKQQTQRINLKGNKKFSKQSIMSVNT